MTSIDARGELRAGGSRIIRVTLFSESAHVTRRVETTLGRGASRIAIDGLPPALDPGSLRVRTSRGVVRAVEEELVDRAPDGTSDSVALRAAIDATRAKRHRLEGEVDALRMELGLLEQLTPRAAELPGGAAALAPLRPEVFLAGLDVVTRRRADTAAVLRRTEAELASTDVELAELVRRLGLVGETAGAARKQSAIVVTLDAADEGAATLDVGYDAAWATWRPYYHVRASAKGDTVECVRFADLWQETGEDWRGVALRLSTAEPEAGLVVPAVLPWTLGLAKSYEDKVADLYKARRTAPPRANGPAGGAEEQAKKRAAPMASAPRASAPAAAMAMPAPKVAPPMPVRSRGGLFGGLGGGGGGAPQPPSDDLEALEIQAEYGATGEVPLTDASFAPDALDAYAAQFREEGAFAEITASGAMAMRSGTVDGATFDGSAAPPGGAPPALGFGGLPGGPARRRGPAHDHPDWARLQGSKLPRDSAGGLDYELEVGGEATVPSGMERQRIGFGSVVYPARIEYLLRPAVKDHAFARVTVVNSDPAPMLAGPAAIFVGDAFFGETAIATTPPGGKLVLDLGAETAIKSARRTKTTVRTEGILTKEDVHVVEVTIEIESFLGRTAELEVQDQVPLSRDPKIKVRLVRTTPKDAVLDELTGVVTFRVRAASGTKTELGLVYEIEAPKDYQFHQVLGG